MKLTITSRRKSNISSPNLGTDTEDSEFITEIECEDSVDFGTTVTDLHKLHEAFHFPPEAQSQ